MGEWVWPETAWKPQTQLTWACVLWTLHDDGPFTNKSGSALRLLFEALQRHRHPALRWTLEGLRQQVRTIEKKAPGLIDRRGNTSSTHYLGLVPGVALPPNPYVLIDDSGAPPGERVELVASTNGFSAADALTAVASFVDSAMAMAGVTHHEVDADERLAEALAENRRLRDALDAQVAQTQDKMRELDVMRRALARRSTEGTPR